MLVMVWGEEGREEGGGRRGGERREESNDKYKKLILKCIASSARWLRAAMYPALASSAFLSNTITMLITKATYPCFLSL